MRDKRFIAEHRGGLLKKEQHRQLILWSVVCVEHLLPLLKQDIDPRIENALAVARAWGKGNASVGEARKASVGVIDTAREAIDPVSEAIARAAGHAVATAHMADHSLGGALYALKAIKAAGQSVDVERQWQNEQIPSEIRELVLSGMAEKEKHFRI